MADRVTNIFIMGNGPVTIYSRDDAQITQEDSIEDEAEEPQATEHEVPLDNGTVMHNRRRAVRGSNPFSPGVHFIYLAPSRLFGMMQPLVRMYRVYAQGADLTGLHWSSGASELTVYWYLNIINTSRDIDLYWQVIRSYSLEEAQAEFRTHIGFEELVFQPEHYFYWS